MQQRWVGLSSTNTAVCTLWRLAGVLRRPKGIWSQAQLSPPRPCSCRETFTCQAIRSLSFSIFSWASGCSCRYRSVKKAWWGQRELLSPPTCPAHRQFGTSGDPQAQGESRGERRPTALPSPGSHPPRVGPSLPKHSGRSVQQKDSVHSLRRPRPQSPARLLLTPAASLLRSWAAFPRCDHQPGLLCTWGRLGRSTTSLSLHGPPSGSALPASVSPLSRPGGLANSPCEEPQLCCHCIGKTASDTEKWMATATLQTPCTKSGGPLCLDHQPMTFNFGSILLRYFSREISWLSPPHQSPSYSKYSNAVVFHYNCILWSLITPGLWTVRRVTLHQHSMVGEWGQCPGQPWPGWQRAEAAPGEWAVFGPLQRAREGLRAWRRGLELARPQGRGCREKAGVSRAFS